MAAIQPLIDRLIELIAQNRNGLGVGLIGLCACVEYLFPPFPGDLVTIFAGFLIARRGWSAPLVMAAVLIGSGVGCLAEYAFGRFVARTEPRWMKGRLGRLRPQLDSLIGRFSRHGSLYIAVNRFLPSIRWLFFIAAGMAGLPVGRVLAFGLLSALVWNGLLLTLGAKVGENWAHVERLLETYGLVVWWVLGALACLWLIRWALRRKPSGR